MSTERRSHGVTLIAGREPCTCLSGPEIKVADEGRLNFPTGGPDSSPDGREEHLAGSYGPQKEVDRHTWRDRCVQPVPVRQRGVAQSPDPG